MIAQAFRIRRASGLTNTQVLLDLVTAHDVPGTVFAYDRLAEELGRDCDREFDRPAVQQAVNLANRRLLRHLNRCLVVVPNEGYRVAHAREHAALADGRNRRGKRQMIRALETLRHARLDEMTEAQRAAHLAQSNINEALVAAVRQIDNHQRRQDRLIAGLFSRVEQLEAKAQ